MGAADTLARVIKSAAVKCRAVFAALLVILFAGSGLAQERAFAAEPAQNSAGGPGISGEKTTPAGEGDIRIEKIPAERTPYSQRPPRYTLLNPRQQAALKDSEAGGPSDPAETKPVPAWGTGRGKSYGIPALEVGAFLVAVNVFARLSDPNDTEDGKKVYSSTFSSAWDNLVRGPWVIDTDSFGVNQLNHPYQGTVYQGLARSSGLGFWESSAYAFAGSFLWEIAGETTKPSINDQVASGIAGNFLGEPLFRMASLLLEDGSPGFWRELAAAVISPPTGFNRFAFGDRFKGVFPSRKPAVFWRVRLGGTWNEHTSGGNPNDFERGEASADFSMAYGLPGKPDYSYSRPFDYFNFEAMVVSGGDNSLENIMTRGLLVGKEYEAGESYRGIWGLFGSYDYISPHFFRVSSTALSMGTVGQWWLARKTALQGSALLGLGWGAAGNISGPGQRDYHYGLTGQGLLGLRLIYGNLAMLEATYREYYVSDWVNVAPQGTEIIGRLNLGATVRVYGHHAVGFQYLLSARDGDYTGLPNQHQRMGTFTLLYSWLSDIGFGAVEWRKGP